MSYSFVHPVIGALSTLDRNADNYQERRIKIINKYTHTIDPVVDVDSDDEDDSEDELDQFEGGMATLLAELTKESQGQSTPQRNAPRISSDLPTLLRLLADSQGVLKGAPAPGPVLSDEEKLVVAAVQQGDGAEAQRLLTVPGRGGLICNAERDTLLHLACRNPVDRVIACVARTKPDLNARNRRGRTPLHELAESGGALALLGSLVKLGADPFARDHLGRSPLQLIRDDPARQQGFEKWLQQHNYVAPTAAEKKPKTVPIPVFTKNGKKVMLELTSESTVQSMLDDSTAIANGELAPLRQVRQHMSVVEYRRKVGDAPAGLIILQPTQRVVELTGTWGEDPCAPVTVYRLLLVPCKGAPKEAVDAYEKAGFGQIGYSKK